MLPYFFLNRNYLKFQFSHFSQTLFQGFTHWTSFPSSIPSIPRSWAFYRKQEIQAKPLRLHSESSHQGCILCQKEVFTDQTCLLLSIHQSDGHPTWLHWSWKSLLLGGQQEAPPCEVPPAWGLAVMQQAESLLLSISNITVSLVMCREYASFIIFSPSNPLG